MPANLDMLDYGSKVIDSAADRPSDEAGDSRARRPAGDDSQRSNLEDEVLVTQLKSGEGSDETYHTLVRKYWPALVGSVRLRVSSLVDAESIAQEAFTKAFRSLDSLETPRCFAAWLFRIAANATTDFIRQRPRAVSLDDILEGGAGDPSLSKSDRSATTVETREQLTRVLGEVARLPEKYRNVVTLRYGLGMSAKDIAAELGEPEGTIRNRVFRALAKLRERLVVSYPGQDHPKSGHERQVHARQEHERQADRRKW